MAVKRGQNKLEHASVTKEQCEKEISIIEREQNKV